MDDYEYRTTTVNRVLSGKPPALVTTLPPATVFSSEEEELRAIEHMMGAKFTANSLSDEQAPVFEKIVDWCEEASHADVLTLGGYAGTGKTTLLCALAHHFEDWRIAFCSLTGKAVSVLKQKFIQQNVLSVKHEISTIHSLLYTPQLDGLKRIIGWNLREELDFDLIVIDEGSMVNEKILNDILSYGIPILAVGDHGQLPPVEGSFNLMNNPQLRLDHIHRQAKGSPVLALTEHIRERGEFPSTYTNTADVQFLRKDQIEEVLTSLYSTPGFRLDDLALLCFKNSTRIKLNDIARSIKWGKGAHEPLAGDQVICLRNSSDRLFNGMRGEISHITSPNPVHHIATVNFPGEKVRFQGALNRHQFGRTKVFKDLGEYQADSGYQASAWEQLGLLVDFGYALTVHKAQGSELPYVVLYDDYSSSHHNDPADFYKRWAYTGVSRCRKHLVVLR